MSIEEAPAADAEQMTTNQTAPDAGTDAKEVPTGNITHVVMEKLRRLPSEKQREVLDFVEFLQQRVAQKRPQRSPEGLWKDLGVHITAEDIAEARREMWGNFPRDDI
jgi:uncharacterized protein DUF2281